MKQIWINFVLFVDCLLEFLTGVRFSKLDISDLESRTPKKDIHLKKEGDEFYRKRQ